MVGTLINCGTVLVGGSLGLLIRNKLPEKVNKIIFHSIGLFTIALGLQMAFRSEHLLIVVLSLVSGSTVGEMLGIENWIHKVSGRWQKNSKDNRFSEGLLTAFLLFCMGSMTILGAFEEGLGKSSELLLTKSIMDGFSAFAFSASLGIGVLFSVVPLLIYQGGLTLFASSLSGFISTSVINEVSATGGILLLGLAMNVLDLKKISVANMLPSLLIAGLLAGFFG